MKRALQSFRDCVTLIIASDILTTVYRHSLTGEAKSGAGRALCLLTRDGANSAFDKVRKIDFSGSRE